MLEIIWRFRTSTLDDESTIIPLLQAVADTPGFEPQRYDLNQKEQWRSFDLEHAVVDALTQRTQLVRIEGGEEGQLAMIALGKREEQPTAIIRAPETQPLEPLVAKWPGLYEDLPVSSTVISSSAWRRALDSLELPPEVAAGLLGMVFGWRRGQVPGGVGDIDAQRVADSPVRLQREASHLVLWLADRPEIEDDAHRAALEYVARQFLRG